METIEERAKVIAEAHGNMYSDYNEGCIANNACELGYINGATEQKKIDIERACDYFRRYNEQCEIQEMVNIDDFRKAMEQ